MDVLSVVEATLDDPRPVLYAQQNKARGEAVAAMKAEGIEYEERMALLEDVTLAQAAATSCSTGALETYRRGHPWVADARLSPKSVARDMCERAMTFVEYVGHYQLARSEGLVLRYLADAYRALRQTVPDEAKTEELTDVVEWLGELVRQVDSSLLDEWEKLAAGRRRRRGGPAAARPAGPRASPATSARSGCWCATRCSAASSWPRCAAGTCSASSTARPAGTPSAGARRWSPTSPSTTSIGTGPDARGPQLFTITEEPQRWLVRQVLDDPAGDRDWAIIAEVDLAASDEEGAAVVWVTAVEPLGGL